MSCAFVAGVNGTLTAASSGVSGSMAVTVGNLLHADISNYIGAGGSPVSSFDGSTSQTWAAANAPQTGGAGSNELRQSYAKNTNGSAGSTFTLTLTGSGFAAFDVMHISGANTISPLRDAGSTADGANATSHPVSTAGTAAQVGDIACGAIGDNATGGTITVGAGYTERFNNANVTTTGLESATLVVTSGGTQTYTPTTANSVKDDMQIAVYAAAAGGRGIFLPPNLNGLGSGGSFFGDRL